MRARVMRASLHAELGSSYPGEGVGRCLSTREAALLKHRGGKASISHATDTEAVAAFLRGLPEKLWSKKVYRPGPARAQGVCVPQRDLGVLIRQFNDIVFLQTHPRHTIHKCTQLPCPLLSVPLSRASHGSRTQRYCRGPERSLCVSACIRAHAHAMQSQQ